MRGRKREEAWGAVVASPPPTYWLYGGQGRARQGRTGQTATNSDSGWNLGVVRPVRSDLGAGRQTGTADFDSIDASR